MGYMNAIKQLFEILLELECVHFLKISPKCQELHWFTKRYYIIKGQNKSIMCSKKNGATMPRFIPGK